MNLYEDYRTNQLKDKMAGRWWVKNRTPFKVNIETIGRSMALSLRVLLRKNIGVESFSFWNVCWGFLWIRLCLVINCFDSEMKDAIQKLFNPFLFTDLATFFLNLFSLFFLCSIIWYYYRTEFPTKKRPFTDVLGRGSSVPLKPIINKTSWFFTKRAFVQSAIAPAIGFLLGGFLFIFEGTIGLGTYFLLSSMALLYDEINYNRSDIRYQRIMKSKIIRARKNQEGFNFGDYDNID